MHTCTHTYTHTFKNVTTTMSILHIITELVNTPTEPQPYCIIVSLVTVLYRITTEFIKLVLNIKQFGSSSVLNFLTPKVQK